MSRGAGSSRIRAWLELIRFPNLFTVWGDPAVGFFLASSVEPVSALPLVFCMAASVCLYVAGILMNGCVDFREDCAVRPGRPLPSGRIGRVQAAIFAVVMVLAGLGCAAGAGRSACVVALALTMTMVWYNSHAKRHRVLGAAVMGVCRVLSLLLGAATAAPLRPIGADTLAAAAGMLLYIGAVTLIADQETRDGCPIAFRWAPVLGPVVWVLAILYRLGSKVPVWHGAMWAASLMAGGWMVFVSLREVRLLKGTPPPAVVSRSVGRLIRNLLAGQAAILFTAVSPGYWLAIAALIAWPISAMLSRRFYIVS